MVMLLDISSCFFFYYFIEDEDEGWAGHQVTEGEIPTRSQRDSDEKRRKEFERKRAKVSQHSLDLEGELVKDSRSFEPR